MLVLILFASLRERLAAADVPAPFQGIAIGMVTAGLMSLAFLGFTGLIKLLIYEPYLTDYSYLCCTGTHFRVAAVLLRSTLKWNLIRLWISWMLYCRKHNVVNVAIRDVALMQKQLPMVTASINVFRVVRRLFRILPI